MCAARAVPLLICSIGNPGAYKNTLHSSGHYVLQRINEHLGGAPFRKSRQHGSGLLSKVVGPQGAVWTLWQSTSYMNDSGKGVMAAYREWLREAEGGKLVIIHDQLEHELARVSLITKPTSSIKGHNGLKSIKASLGETPFARIGIGIGRPVSREPDDVARYVLRRMTPAEMDHMDRSVDKVIESLERIDNS